MKKSKMLFVVLNFSTIIIFIIVGCTQWKSEPLPPPTEPKPQSTAELKAQVDKLLASGDDVMIRGDVDDIFMLVDRLVESERKNEALQYLAPALKHNSWAFDYQLLYARLLQDRGGTETPRKIAKLVLQYAEKDKQINEARQLLHQDPVPKPAPMKPIKPEGVTVVLVPIGELDINVLEDLRLRLVKRLGITVLIKDLEVSVPEYSRDPFEQVLSEMRENIQASIEKDFRVRLLLIQDGITIESLQNDAKVVEAYRRLILSYKGTDSLSKFDARMRQLRTTDKQWEIRDIKKNLKIAAKPFLNDNIYFLGVVDLDVFSGESNFLFYMSDSNGHIAIMSYRRFTADFNQDTPKRERLVERTLKSSLGCIGFMLGVPRCSTPTCPRTYPNDLREFDATSIYLCDECRNGFKDALGGLPDRD